MANTISSIKVGDATGVFAIPYATCSTAASTTAKVATVQNNGNFSLETGAMVVVSFTNANTASNATLNVSETGAKEIWYKGGKITGGLLGSNRPYIFIYDGSYWVLTGEVGEVYQSSSGTANYRPLLMHYNSAAAAGTDPGATRGQVYYNAKISAKPSTGELYATKFNEDGTLLSNKYLSKSGGTVSGDLLVDGELQADGKTTLTEGAHIVGGMSVLGDIHFTQSSTFTVDSASVEFANDVKITDGDIYLDGGHVKNDVTGKRMYADYNTHTFSGIGFNPTAHLAVAECAGTGSAIIAVKAQHKTTKHDYCTATFFVNVQQNSNNTYSGSVALLSCDIEYGIGFIRALIEGSSYDNPSNISYFCIQPFDWNGDGSDYDITTNVVSMSGSIKARDEVKWFATAGTDGYGQSGSTYIGSDYLQVVPVSTQNLGTKVKDYNKSSGITYPQTKSLGTTSGWYRVATIRGSRAVTGKISVCVDQNMNNCGQVAIVEFGGTQELKATLEKILSYRSDSGSGYVSKVRVASTKGSTTTNSCYFYVDIYWEGKTSCNVTVDVSNIVGAPAPTSISYSNFSSNPSTTNCNLAEISVI